MARTCCITTRFPAVSSSSDVMGCSSSAEADDGQEQGNQKRHVYDISNQQQPTLHPPQRAIAIKTLIATNNLLSRLPDMTAIKAFMALETIDMSGNRFTKIPEQLSGLPKLTSINFSSNPMARAGAYDAIMSLPKLQVVILRDVGMKNVPGPLLACRGVSSLDLSSNSNLILGGKGAPAFDKMTQLRQLKVSSCELAGEVPSGLRAAKLTSLDISGNPKLDLSDPKTWGNLRKSLLELDISDMALFALPRGVCSCTAVKNLRLQGNRMLETVSGLIFLADLFSLDISRCNLLQLPTDLDQAERLQEIHVNDNFLASDPSKNSLFLWRLPATSPLSVMSVFSTLSVVDISSDVHFIDPNAVLVLSQCRQLSEITLAKASMPRSTTMPLMFADLPRLTTFNTIPVPVADASRLMNILKGEQELRLAPTMFSYLPGEAVCTAFCSWLTAFHDSRTQLSLNWSIAVARYRAFVLGLDELQGSVSERSPKKATPASAGVCEMPPLDVAAAHVGFLLAGYLHGGRMPPGAPYCGVEYSSSNVEDLWTKTIQRGGVRLPADVARYDVLSNRNPLDLEDVTLTDVDPLEDHARDLLLRFASAVVDAKNRGLQVDDSSSEYVRLLSLKMNASRYLPLQCQIALISHFVLDPACFARDLEALELPVDLAMPFAKVCGTEGVFEVSDAALGRTTAAWDATYKQHCPWLSAVAKGGVAVGELIC
jgi:Leucine-rich repeat (LRR) protein